MLASIATITFLQGLSYAFVALGVYLSFRVLDFPDLTVDGSFPMGAAIAAVIIAGGGDPFLATLAGLGGGLGAGLITGLLNTKLKINALLSGILSMIALYSINLMIMGRANVSLLRVDGVFDKIANLFALEATSVLTIIVLAVLAAIVLLLLTWFLHTQIGLAIRATGDNEQMIRGLGVDTNKTKLIGLSLSNGLVALSGALVAQDQGFADIGMGIGMIIIGLASVIIGESIFRPKRIGWVVFSVVVGSIIYRLFIAVALRMGLAPGNLKLITAVLVVLVLALPRVREWLSSIMNRVRGHA